MKGGQPFLLFDILLWFVQSSKKRCELLYWMNEWMEKFILFNWLDIILLLFSIIFDIFSSSSWHFQTKFINWFFYYYVIM